MWCVLLSVGLATLVTGQSLRFKPHGSTPSDSILCPDKQGTCPDLTTCCPLPSGKYGCCPLPSAICCSDHLHCCPGGYKCDLAASTCTQGNKTVAMVTKKPANQVADINDITCPGGQMSCLGGTTCCKLQSGGWGCCPMPKATCCDDGIHCCPTGYKCNKRSSTCEQSGNTNSWFLLKPAKSATQQRQVSTPSKPISSDKHTLAAGVQMMKPVVQKKGRHVCPGGQTYCDSGNTCCFKDKWNFNCCPFINGICCAGGDHCCPLGFSCDIKLGKCTKGAGMNLPWGNTHESKKSHEPEPEEPIRPLEGDSVVCPGGQSSCPDGSTCCMLVTGQYGCCPLPQAVCCSDDLHCCPAGSVCDVESQTCKQQGLSVPWSAKTPSNPHAKKMSSECPDNKTSCSTGTTCCPMLDGYFACCPFNNAKCCPDKLHCCPHNQECDAKKGECVTPDTAPQQVSEAQRNDPVMSQRVLCPDHASYCPAQTTCCLLQTKQFGCCPLPQADCCADGIHCCPAGYTCDTKKGSCQKLTHTIPWAEKFPAKPVNTRATWVVCPDKRSQCADGQTCCKLTSGEYGCCPLPKAVCCSDGLHCCPEGSTCDAAQGACSSTSNSLVTSWSPVLRSTPKVMELDSSDVTCPDQTICPNGATCCKTNSGVFGCCPYTKAVCCSDGSHCCPPRSTCDVAHGTCSSTDNSLVISWSSMLRSTPKVLKLSSEKVTCPDKTACPDGSTCCNMTSGAYGCCPYTKGSCCADQVHCCPEGFHCDKTGLRCDTVDSSIRLTSTMFTRFKPQPASVETDKVSIIKCPDGKEECPEGSTCCRQPSGQYGCCSFKNAVCCSDGVHCCPQGYACDPQSGTCTQAIPWLTKVPATPIPTLGEIDTTSRVVVCPDHEHQCPEQDTCCKMTSGEWGCCTLPQAVCCDDGEHCCPRGYRCLVQQGRCVDEKYVRNNHPLAFRAITTKADRISHSEP